MTTRKVAQGHAKAIRAAIHLRRSTNDSDLCDALAEAVEGLEVAAIGGSYAAAESLRRIHAEFAGGAL